MAKTQSQDAARRRTNSNLGVYDIKTYPTPTNLGQTWSPSFEISLHFPWNPTHSRLPFISSTQPYGIRTTSQQSPCCFSQTLRSAAPLANLKPDIPNLPATSISFTRLLVHTIARFSTWWQKAISVLRECAFQELTVETSLVLSQQGRGSNGLVQHSLPSATGWSLTSGFSAMCMDFYSSCSASPIQSGIPT